MKKIASKAVRNEGSLSTRAQSLRALSKCLSGLDVRADDPRLSKKQRNVLEKFRKNLSNEINKISRKNLKKNSASYTDHLKRVKACLR